MGFLIRMAFWFSLVLLLLPFDTGGGEPGVNPVQAFFAAKEAVNDVAGICDRKPEVCEVGAAAMQTIGARAKESARMAYEMLEDNGATPAAQGRLPEADVESLIGSEGADLVRTDGAGHAGQATAFP